MKQETKNNFIIWTDRLLTRTIYLVYPVLLVILFMRKDPDLIPAIAVPGISFILVSIFRSRLNSPRPYEVTGRKPIINKDSSGKSFPSRHVFSIFIIAVTLFYFYPLAGILVGLAGLLLAAVRVLGGVHFVKDVVAGALIGIICGVVGLLLVF